MDPEELGLQLGPRGGSSNKLSWHRQDANLHKRRHQGIQPIFKKKKVFILGHSEQEPREISSAQGGGAGGGSWWQLSPPPPPPPLPFFLGFFRKLLEIFFPPKKTALSWILKW